jgi:hypothetical protein
MPFKVSNEEFRPQSVPWESRFNVHFQKWTCGAAATAVRPYFRDFGLARHPDSDP